ncbi:MAG: serpin family protein, partial [Myxococcales bacterium FL481]
PSDSGDEPSDSGDDPSDSGDDPSDSGDDPEFEELVSDAEHDLEPDATPEELAEMRAGNVELGFELLRRAAAGEDINLAVSAVSVRAAFGMVHAMARGATATEIADTLGFLSDRDRTHNALNAHSLALESRNLPETEEEDPVIYSPANRMFVSPSVAVGPMFLDTLATNYGAGVFLADFADPEDVRVRINSWVSGRTYELIPALLPGGSLTDQSKWVLVNAIYLKAPWRTPFEAAYTADAPFTRLDGSTVQVPTMHNKAVHGSFRAGDGYQLVELPLRGGELAVTIIVPDTGRYLEQEAALTTETLDAMLSETESDIIDLSLPKFTIATGSIALSGTLRNMGMVTPFSPDADFSGINDGASGVPPIGFVLHSVFVAVDEAGVEAAAATAVGDDDSEPSPAFVLDVDRPFLFLVRDRPTGLVLFTGRVLDPSK